MKLGKMNGNKKKNDFQCTCVSGCGACDGTEVVLVVRNIDIVPLCSAIRCFLQIIDFRGHHTFTNIWKESKIITRLFNFFRVVVFVRGGQGQVLLFIINAIRCLTNI